MVSGQVHFILLFFYCFGGFILFYYPYPYYPWFYLSAYFSLILSLFTIYFFFALFYLSFLLFLIYYCCFVILR